MALVDSLAAPLLAFLSDDSSTELVVNEPGVAFVETAGRWERIEDKVFDDRNVSTFITAVDSFASGNLAYGRTCLLSTALPTGERIQIVKEPAVEKSFALAIRKPGAIQLTIDDYDKAGSLDAIDLEPLIEGDNKKKDALLELLVQGQVKSFLKQAVLERKTIVISGGTNSGKTTFFNALAQLIPHDERLISIEDSRELNLQQPNKLHLIAQRGSKHNTYLSLLEACLRLRPDRILAAELRGEETFAFLSSVNTSHPGSITTIYANSTSSARDRLMLMLAQARLAIEPEMMKRYVENTIDIFIQITRCQDGRRRVTEISYKDQTFGGEES